MTQTAIRTIHDGFYTVATPDYGHRTFRIRTQPDDSTFAPGKQIIGYLNGPSNESDYINFAFVNGRFVNPWKRFQTGYNAILEAARFLVSPGSHQAECGKYYALTSGNCYVCNRLLTTPESVAAGIGPTCASRL